MIQTFAALLLAHALADFLLQSNAMAAAKQNRAPGPFALHLVIVAATASLALAPTRPDALMPVLAVTLAHGVIDLAKSFLPNRLATFLADQALHLLSLLAIACWLPLDPAQTFWPPLAPAVMALAAGAILATRAGGFAVGLLMLRWADAPLPKGLPRGGEHIGLMERGLIFLFVLGGQPSAIGFLIAAKSILRFDTAREDQAMGEYVIIGTLASFGWALLAAYGTLALLAHLPSLGIPALNP